MLHFNIIIIIVLFTFVPTGQAHADREYRDSDRYKGIFNHRIRRAAPQLNWSAVDEYRQRDARAYSRTDRKKDTHRVDGDSGRRLGIFRIFSPRKSGTHERGRTDMPGTPVADRAEGSR